MTDTKGTLSILLYIEDRVEKIPFSGCWIWMRSLQGRGYGALVRDKKAWLAHRFSYSMLKGPIPDGALVCHRCDVPQCVNPAHLFTGSNMDNLLDSITKGRRPKTVSTRGHCKNASLTAEQVEQIKYAINTRVGSLRTVAENAGIPYHVIKDISCGRHY